MKKILVILLISFTSLSYASQNRFETWDFAQDKKKECRGGNMMEMNMCLAQAYAESDARLNLVYRHLIDALADPVPLRQAQRAWIKFRDLQCEFEVPPSWTGSGVPYSRNSCLIDHTERRIRDLERVRPCNGCVEFKPEYYEYGNQYKLPPRR